MSAGIGTHRTVVSVQSLTEAHDSYGQAAKTWTTTRTFRGLMRTPRGAEIFNAGQRKAVSEIVIEAGRDAALLAHTGEITENHRLLINGVQYGIEWIDPILNDQRAVNIHCKKQASPVKAL